MTDIIQQLGTDIQTLISDLQALATELAASVTATPPTAPAPAPTPAPTATAQAAIEVDVIQESTVFSNDDLSKFVAAAQAAHDQDFGPVWNTSVHLNAVTDKASANPNHWWLVVADTSDQAGALGYHELNPAGLPIGYAFAKTCLDAGTSVTVDLSHELWEMLADPYCDECAISDSNQLWGYEVGDPVEDDACGFTVDGVLLSDFVYPQFFQTGSTNGTPTPGPFDKTGSVSAAFSLATRGYAGILDLNNVGAGWQQIWGDAGVQADKLPSALSRRARRSVSKENWHTTV